MMPEPSGTPATLRATLLCTIPRPSCKGTRELSLAYQASDGSIKPFGQPFPDRGSGLRTCSHRARRLLAASSCKGSIAVSFSAFLQRVCRSRCQVLPSLNSATASAPGDGATPIPWDCSNSWEHFHRGSDEAAQQGDDTDEA